MASNGQGDKTFTQPVNWITTFFMGAFHIGAIAALFFFGWKPLSDGDFSLVGCRESWRRHGLSPAADPSRLQDAQSGWNIS